MDNSAEYVALGNSATSVFLKRIYGYTGLFVTSLRGIYRAHILESPGYPLAGIRAASARASGISKDEGERSKPEPKCANCGDEHPTWISTCHEADIKAATAQAGASTALRKSKVLTLQRYFRGGGTLSTAESKRTGYWHKI